MPTTSLTTTRTTASSTTWLIKSAVAVGVRLLALALVSALTLTLGSLRLTVRTTVVVIVWTRASLLVSLVLTRLLLLVFPLRRCTLLEVRDWLRDGFRSIVDV